MHPAEIPQVFFLLKTLRKLQLKKTNTEVDYLKVFYLLMWLTLLNNVKQNTRGNYLFMV